LSGLQARFLCQRLDAFARGVRELLAVLLRPLSGELRCALPNLLGEVLALVKRLTTDVPRLLLHLV
jgi:hypothetical protein